jgi:hypothetical protein
MKIVDIAKCVDNVDPLGIGRIRVSRYNEYTGQKEKAIDYEPWSDRDLFLAYPFLPANMNYIPEINQSVKLIQYDTDKDTVNVEYVAGPFTSMYDFNGQTFSQQIANTTYGSNVKHKPAIRNTTGQYINKKSENTFANEKDFAIYGKYGSDLLFTENGLQLRGGKLLSKEAASAVNRQTLVDYPLMSIKASRIYLKKFPKKLTIQKVNVTNTSVESKDMNYIVEYSVDSLSDGQTGYTISLYVYKIISSYGETFKTNYFTEHTDVPSSYVKLINTDGTNTTPTYTETVGTIYDVYKEIRDKIFLIHDKSLSELNNQYDSSDIHPFFFRPTNEFKTRPVDIVSGTTQSDNRQTILNNINVLRVGPSTGLIWSVTSAKPTSQKVDSVEEQLVLDPNSPEQTFGTVSADKIYFLSTDLGDNQGPNPVPFYDLNGYDYTQEDYINKIDKNTFSTVRGENLLNLLNKIIEVIFTHRHNPLMNISGQYDYTQGNELKELYKTIENDILNKSIRIN